jgi:glyoxylate utilization-related uncharacterized protein
MPDVTIKRLDELPAHGQGVFIAARDALGVSSFGINIERWPPNDTGHPEHDELESGQEEVYFVVEGSATLIVDGEEHLLDRLMFARVGAASRRKIISGPHGVTLLCLGAVPGGAYTPSGPTG